MISSAKNSYVRVTYYPNKATQDKLKKLPKEILKEFARSILNDSSNVIPFKIGNNSSELKEMLNEEFRSDIRDYVIIDGEYYHAKMVTTREMLNELIGSYYSRLVGLDAVDYKPSAPRRPGRCRSGWR